MMQQLYVRVTRGKELVALEVFDDTRTFLEYAAFFALVETEPGSYRSRDYGLDATVIEPDDWKRDYEALYQEPWQIGANMTLEWLASQVDGGMAEALSMTSVAYHDPVPVGARIAIRKDGVTVYGTVTAASSPHRGDIDPGYDVQYTLDDGRPARWKSRLDGGHLFPPLEDRERDAMGELLGENR